jgi:hypothetical protein
LRFDSRSPASSSLASGRPIATLRTRDQARPSAVFGSWAAAFATIWPGPV